MDSQESGSGCCLGKPKAQNNRLGSNQIIDDNLLAREMNSLSVTERDQLYDEIHGIADIIEETPELVKTSLEQMRKSLSAMGRRTRKELDRAFFLKPTLERDDKFHLMFLRAAKFDPRRAAARLARYFVHKRELWGLEKLVKKINIDDLGEEEMNHLYAGTVSFSGVNERGFRTLYVHPQNIPDTKARVRHEWYQLMTFITEDEEVQKKGTVGVVSLHGPSCIRFTQALELDAKYGRIVGDWPVRIVGHHICHESTILDNIVRLALAMIGKELRLHTRSHCGSILEVQYALMSFGIKLSKGVFEPDGVHNKARMNAFVDERRRIEAEFSRQEMKEQDGSTTRPFLYPRPHDVLMGRGRPFRDWPGNVRLFGLVADHTDQYLAAKKRIDKSITAFEIVNSINESGGHFIERTENGWVVVDADFAKKKISQLLRASVRDKQSAGKNGGLSEESNEESGGGEGRQMLFDDDYEYTTKRARTEY